ncbi:MAG: aspartate--tRNA(Asn) ligase [Methanocalculus sp. MSAO_Arc1]|uniref:aspartate--tRNA(Asn) ligase n=1 Tax=Methanocalculus TaxID=71151 RepID=UPI000FF333A7|nr:MULTISPECIES: aspartate--tRNA(Asn) ligase [unclassified Methanocalculus]MCP1662877.1 aspartyl-tRNA synthetase [Methanocalculus sp. AMF5]RQD82067.1 MAG: aspartate--tRNA(Asn) ligase [Methanocalculus sp. MSAO_Arc1]
MRIPVAEVTADMERAAIAGWVHEERDLGGLAFFLVRDRTGIIQVTVPKKKVPEEVLKAIKEVSRESVVRVEGVVKATEKAPGGRELVPETFVILAKAASPLPLDVAEKVPAEIDTRLDARFLDVRRPKIASIFAIRSRVMETVHSFLFREGFLHITTPKVVAAATEGGTELFPIAYFEKEAFLSQSPQLYKQMMMSAGCEKVFEIGPIFRAEEHNTVRHLNEATSIDIEVSFADHEDVMQILERMMHEVYTSVADDCGSHLEHLGIRDLEIPGRTLARLPYAEAIEIAAEKIEEPIQYGDDLGTASERAIGEEMGEHYFITEWPTAIRPYYAMPSAADDSICNAFDLMHPKMELSSGAQRCHVYEILVRQLQAKGLSPEGFEFYLRPFQYGMPPHAGWGLGAERLVMTICGLQNIREAVLFPRDRHRVTP